MRTCEDGCNGCDKCTDYEDQEHRPPRFLRDELGATSNRTVDWYMAVVWPLLPVPGEFDAMDACDQSRWRSVVRLAIEYALAGERGAQNERPLTDHDRALTGAKLTGYPSDL